MSEASDLFFEWSNYATNLLNESQQPLSFPDWLVDQTVELTVQQIIESLLSDQSDTRLSFASSTVPPDLFSESEPILPLPHLETSDVGYFSITPTNISTFFLSVLPFQPIPVSSYSYRLAIYDSFQNYTYYYLPYIYYISADIPTLYYLSFQSLNESNVSSYEPDNYSVNYPTLLADGSYEGDCGFINLTIISVAQDCDCCGCCAESGDTMANCQDLVNAVLAIKEQQEFLNTKYETILDQVTNIATSNAQIAELLNLRLVHRDFTVQAVRDLQAGLGLAASTISQRTGLIAHSIGGFAIPSSNIPDPPVTDSALNQDTPPSGGSDGGADGGDGGDGDGGDFN